MCICIARKFPVSRIVEVGRSSPPGNWIPVRFVFSASEPSSKLQLARKLIKSTYARGGEPPSKSQLVWKLIESIYVKEGSKNSEDGKFVTTIWPAEHPVTGMLELVAVSSSANLASRLAAREREYIKAADERRRGVCVDRGIVAWVCVCCRKVTQYLIPQHWLIYSPNPARRIFRGGGFDMHPHPECMADPLAPSRSRESFHILLCAGSAALDSAELPKNIFQTPARRRTEENVDVEYCSSRTGRARRHRIL